MLVLPRRHYKTEQNASLVSVRLTSFVLKIVAICTHVSYINFMKLVPLRQKEAKAFVNSHHRHHKAPVGDIYRIGLESDGELIGCIMIGRPVARCLDDGYTVEVNRCCVLDGYRNACSMLYGAAARVAKSLGYTKILTYTLAFDRDWETII